MTFTPVGSSFTWDTTPINFTPHTVGNLIVVGALTKVATTPTVIGLSSSNVTWTQLTTTYTGTNSNSAGNIWVGTVTSTSAAVVTVTWSTGSAPSFWQFDGQEFSSTVGSWALDQQGHIDFSTSNSAYASLTPAAAGELYFGTHFDSLTSSAGSTSGYTYLVDSHSNGMAYNANCTASAQAPTWADSGVRGGPMALIKETGGAPPAPKLLMASFP